MIRLIGLRWTHGNMWSREVLIVRGLAIVFVFHPMIIVVLRHLFQYSHPMRSLIRHSSMNSFHFFLDTKLDSELDSEFSPLRFPNNHNKKTISLGDDCAGDTPLPIPNRVVKPRCADGTASELVWQSR